MSRTNASGHEDQENGRENQSQTMTALLRLRELLLSGQFLPGERMAELPLAARLNVSRTPLRLALTTLEHEGLLEMHPTRGFLVRAITLGDIYDSIEVRGVLEGTAARFAAERLPLDSLRAQKSLIEIRECVRALNVAVHASTSDMESLTQYIEWNGRFHALLLDLAESEILTREMERIVRLPFASPNSGFLLVQTRIPESREVLMIGQDQHRAILDAIEKREGTRAESLAREHSRLSRRNLEIALNDQTLRHLVPGGSLIRDTNFNIDLPAATRTH
ncbi:GntR family transcriptional regulator [Tunturiibacter empetritectus]|uniref:GntR family transcriptional regulator of vanillate catabolism n=1 Tax=Tunturiibacter lichenicola TaxID=2051959 RepID=A0A852VNC0_9BACT|nr:GntR family transcriptional regulator [Edaphobacter lichenicola]NYF91555.1 GntR family transcriptional regulator of vanillate catabolism [Edaphobacter lichenicola]